MNFIMTTVRTGLSVLVCACGALAGGFADFGQEVIIESPAPEINRWFAGTSMDRLGTDRFIVGESGTIFGFDGTFKGAVHVFDLDASLLLTITNPLVSVEESLFGTAVAGLGTQRIVVGDNRFETTNNLFNPEGIVYVFDDSGALMATVTNPSTDPANDGFGENVEAITPGLFLVGARDAGPHEQGAAFLYDATGNLLHTLANPHTNFLGNFGLSFSRLGTDRFLVGDPGHRPGSVYMYDFSGNLLATVSNTAPRFPALESDFGWSIAPVGESHFLVGDINQRQALLFDASGTYVMSVPDPITNDVYTAFASMVEGLGESCFVVASPNVQIGSSEAPITEGLCYLYSTSGVLQATITNSFFATENQRDFFGNALSAVGTNRVVIGSPEAGSTTNGVAFMYTLAAAFPDPFEPDDTPRHAHGPVVGVEEIHSFHDAGDRDWIRFVVTPLVGFNIDAVGLGADAEPVIELFKVEANGSLTLIPNKKGPSPGARSDSQSLSSATGTHYARVTNTDPGKFGKNTSYKLGVTANDPGFTSLAIIVVDLFSPGGVSAPSNTFLSIDSGAPIPMPSGNIFLTNFIAAGIHTVAVSVAQGYVGDQDPEKPNQIHNPDNILFGNPKRVNVIEGMWNFCPFAFFPAIQIEGRLRDSVTGEWITNAALSFEAQGGVFDSLVFTQYPGVALWAGPWYSGIDGTFPTNVILPQGEWDLTISSDLYNGALFTGAVLVTDASVDLGRAWLTAVDTNSNGIADAWELQYFGGSVVGINDSDGDGISNHDEYRLGTNPTNGMDVFQSDVSGPLTNRIAICWTGHSGREYEIQCTTILVSNAWQRVYGPVTAQVANTQFCWRDTQPLASTGRYYRVRALLP